MFIYKNGNSVLIFSDMVLVLKMISLSDLQLTQRMKAMGEVFEMLDSSVTGLFEH